LNNPSTGFKISFNQDCWLPFIKRFAEKLHEVHPSALIFFEPVPNELPPTILNEEDNALGLAVYSPQ